MDSPQTITFCAAFVLAGLAAVSLVLVGRRNLTARVVVGTFLFNGFLGLSVALGSYEWMQPRTWAILSLAILAGFGGRPIMYQMVGVLIRLPEVLDVIRRGQDRDKDP